MTGSFEAFGRHRDFPSSAFWSDPKDGLLFLFHLHGFRPLAAYTVGEMTAEGDSFWLSVIDSWLTFARQPKLPAWHPYPTSLRLISWAAALSSVDRWSGTVQRGIAREIWRQAFYLRRVIEDDIGGNHVLKNATALCFAGAVLPTSGLLDAGLGVLRREVPGQILGDGGHEERSTSYHREVTGDLIAVTELLARSDREEPGWLRDAIQRAQQWQRAMTGPDGRLPLLNDAWEGSPLGVTETGPPPSQEPGEDVIVLRQSGHVVLRHCGDQAVFDAGPLCPAHLPPHAHADALSFVLWIDGTPVVVDPGSGSYHGPERDSFRGTAAHNTVEVDGCDQCVFWGDFRAGLLPRVIGPHVRREHGIVIVEASHNGYRRLKDPVTHHRAFLWWPGAGIVIIDRLGCRAPHVVRSRICLPPDTEVSDPTKLRDLNLVAVGPGGTTRIEPRSYSPALGRVEPTIGLCWQGRVSPREPFGWTMLRSGTTAAMNADGAVSLAQDGRALSLALSPV